MVQGNYAFERHGLKMGKNLDRLRFILGYQSIDSNGNVVAWSDRAGEELHFHKKDKDGNVETLIFPLTEEGATQLDKQINRSMAEAVLSLPESVQESKPKTMKEPPPEPIDSDVLIRIASYFGQGMSQWDAAANAGIFASQEKEFNKYWKSLVAERKRMRGGR